MKTILLVKMSAVIALAGFLIAPGSVRAQAAASGVVAKIEALRTQRETAIAQGIAKANADYGAALDKMKAVYASDPAAAG